MVNISGMSFGAISKPAVQALSRGAALAGCWMDTGEGGTSPYHLEGGCDVIAQIEELWEEQLLAFKQHAERSGRPRGPRS